jgi:hypothetical protein
MKRLLKRAGIAAICAFTARAVVAQETVAVDDGVIAEAPPVPTTEEVVPEDKPLAPKNPYSAIVARNPFGLKPEPPPPEPPAPQPTVSTTALKLTGVTTLLGGKRAMFVVEEPGKTNLVSDLVREGDWDTYITNLQVLKIDERAGAVNVVYGGKELALNFKDNGIKPPTGPAPVPVPGAGAPGVGGRPGAIPGAPPPITVGAVIPGAPVNVSQPVTTGQPVGSGLRQVPSRPSRMPAGGMPTAAAEIPTMTPDQQALAMKAQEILARQQGVALPPTPPIPGIDFPPGPGAGGFPMPPGGPPMPGTQ